MFLQNKNQSSASRARANGFRSSVGKLIQIKIQGVFISIK